MKVTVLPVPTCLLAKEAEPLAMVTSSSPTTPVRVASPAAVAFVLPSYSLLCAVRPVMVTALGFTVRWTVAEPTVVPLL